MEKNTKFQPKVVLNFILILFFKEGGNAFFYFTLLFLICLETCSRILSKVKDRFSAFRLRSKWKSKTIDQLSDQNNADIPEVSNARYNIAT